MTIELIKTNFGSQSQLTHTLLSNTRCSQKSNNVMLFSSAYKVLMKCIISMYNKYDYFLLKTTIKLDDIMCEFYYLEMVYKNFV